MELLLKFARIEVGCLLIGLMIAIVYSLLFKVGSESKITSQARDRRSESIINMQLGLITILVAIYLIVQVAQNPTKFPDIPPALLALLGLSGGTQVGMKYYALTRIKDNPKT